MPVCKIRGQFEVRLPEGEVPYSSLLTEKGRQSETIVYIDSARASTAWQIKGNEAGPSS